MTSVKQIIANKNNASKSTGPRSLEGKSKIAKNAIKHGLLSSSVVIDTDELKENQEEFQQLRENLVKDLKPEGILEELLVNRIASTYWRLNRVLNVEQGEIKKQTGNLFFNELIGKSKEANDLKQFPSLTPFKEKLLNSIYAKTVLEKLQIYKEIVEQDGYLVGGSWDEYVELKAMVLDRETFNVTHFFQEIAQGKIPEQDKDKGKRGLLELINKDISLTKSMLEATEELDEMNMENKRLIGQIPSGESSERIIRYETALENQLYKAINQLIKIQSLRSGGRYLSIKSAEIEGLEI